MQHLFVFLPFSENEKKTEMGLETVFLILTHSDLFVNRILIKTGAKIKNGNHACMNEHF
jgi:hypothetical protein